jgi:pimeloyl-ACP methyl ester carboxylesterase
LPNSHPSPREKSVFKNKRTNNPTKVIFMPFADPSHADEITIATCRAEPTSTNLHNHVPLPAGHYRMLRVTRGSCVSSGVCNYYSCENGLHYCTQDITEDLPKGDVVIVVHGFNCTEMDGVATIYNTRDLLSVWGVTIAMHGARAVDNAVHLLGFTWPCEHTLFPGYAVDKQTVARFAAFSLANLIIDLYREDPARRIHIIAHSMGCFLTLKSLNMLALLHGIVGDPPQQIIDNAIWLAPDVNASALERSTPDLPLPTWNNLGIRTSLKRLQQAWARPATNSEIASIAQQSPLLPQGLATTVRDHPLDGYGYAAIDLIRHLTIYSSLYDQALLVSPFANRMTEDSGSASGGIRLGWCGPLHPDLMMVPNSDVNYRARQVTLVECSQIVHEHGDYFYHPVTQCDIANRILSVRHEQPSDLLARGYALLKVWHIDSPMAYPPRGTEVPEGLTMCALTMPKEPFIAPPGAPTRTIVQTPFARIWHFPLTAVILRSFIALLRRYYRI